MTSDEFSKVSERMVKANHLHHKIEALKRFRDVVGNKCKFNNDTMLTLKVDFYDCDGIQLGTAEDITLTKEYTLRLIGDEILKLEREFSDL